MLNWAVCAVSLSVFRLGTADDNGDSGGSVVGIGDNRRREVCAQLPQIHTSCTHFTFSWRWSVDAWAAGCWLKFLKERGGDTKKNPKWRRIRDEDAAFCVRRADIVQLDYVCVYVMSIPRALLPPLPSRMSRVRERVRMRESESEWERKKICVCALLCVWKCSAKQICANSTGAGSAYAAACAHVNGHQFRLDGGGGHAIKVHGTGGRMVLLCVWTRVEWSM